MINKKSIALALALSMLPLSSARAQTADPFELVNIVFAASEELLACDNLHFNIDYFGCDDSLNYYNYYDGYSTSDLEYNITITTEKSQECHYNKLMTDKSDGDVLWQSYIVACGIKFKEAPSTLWTLNGEYLTDHEVFESDIHYDMADELIYGISPQVKIRKRGKYTYIYHLASPLMSAYKLERKTKRGWRVIYDTVIGYDITGEKERLSPKTRYRLTVTRFDGKVLYKRSFLAK